MSLTHSPEELTKGKAHGVTPCCPPGRDAQARAGPVSVSVLPIPDLSYLLPLGLFDFFLPLTLSMPRCLECCPTVPRAATKALVTLWTAVSPWLCCPLRQLSLMTSVPCAKASAVHPASVCMQCGKPAGGTFVQMDRQMDIGQMGSGTCVSGEGEAAASGGRRS